MSAEYTLKIKNDGTECGDVCILQTCRDNPDQNIIVSKKEIQPCAEIQCCLKVPVITANPNLNFIPHPEYWIAFGKFEEGEVIDKNRLSQKYKIKFDDNNECAIVLQPDNTIKQSE